MAFKKWEREELILALYWYKSKITFTQIKYTKPEVIELANITKRTPSSAALKLVNFARLDPVLQLKGIKGMRKGSKAEKVIWDEFETHPEKLEKLAKDILSRRVCKLNCVKRIF